LSAPITSLLANRFRRETDREVEERLEPLELAGAPSPATKSKIARLR